MANSDSELKAVGILVIYKYSWRAVGKKKLNPSLGALYTHLHCKVPWKGYIELLRSSSCQKKEVSVRRGSRLNPRSSGAIWWRLRGPEFLAACIPSFLPSSQ